MQNRILIVAATDAEADALRRISGMLSSPEGFILGNCEISLLITGVGAVSTAWTLTKWFSVNQKPELTVNIGIAGSYREDIKIGDVVIPVSDCFADSGIETKNGFISLAEAGMEDPDRFPFKDGKIRMENKFIELNLKNLRHVNAITVNSASGSVDSIGKLIKKYDPDIETMEGATFFYICSREKVPFLAMRSISNRVEPRDKGKWDITFALNSLSEKLGEFILTLD